MSNLEEEFLSGASSLSFLSKPKLVTRSSSTKPQENAKLSKAAPFDRTSKPTPLKPVIPSTSYCFHFCAMSRPSPYEKQDSKQSLSNSEASDDAYSSKSEYSASSYSSKDAPKRTLSDNSKPTLKAKTLDDYPAATAEIRNSLNECSNNVGVLFLLLKCVVAQADC